LEGCHLNSLLLQEAIHGGTAPLESMGVLWIDFRNAFGAVDHSLIEYALKWLNVPAYIRDVAMDLYVGAGFQVQHKDGWTDPIHLTRGVKQGDGLSPLLFNLALEILLRWLHTTATVDLAGMLLSSLAYADDIASLAMTKAEMQKVIISKLLSFCNWANIEPRADKCAAGMLKRSRRGHRRKLTKARVKFNGDAVPDLKIGEHYAYLGTEFCLSEEKEVKGIMTRHVQKLHAANIAGWMKKKLFDGWVMPKLTFRLATPKVSKAWMEKKDSYVRQTIKKWNGLPPCTSTGYIYAARADGGLQVPNIVHDYVRLQTTVGLSALTHRDPTVSNVANASYNHTMKALTQRCLEIDATCAFAQAALASIDNGDIISTADWTGMEARFEAEKQYKKAGQANDPISERVAFWAGLHRTLADLKPEWRIERSPWDAATMDGGIVPKLPKTHFCKVVDATTAREIPPKARAKALTTLFHRQNLDKWKLCRVQGQVARCLPTDEERAEVPSRDPEVTHTLQGRIIESVSFDWLKNPATLPDIMREWGVKCVTSLMACRWWQYKWGYATNKLCQYCKEGLDTPLHALNGCQHPARMQLFTQRHNAVQDVVVKACLGRRDDISVDMPILSDYTGTVLSNLRPDLVLYDSVFKRITVVDFKCPFASGLPHWKGIHAANQLKYSAYVDAALARGWNLKVYTAIVSSQGLVPACTKLALEALGFAGAKSTLLMKAMVKAALSTGSNVRRTLSYDTTKQRNQPWIPDPVPPVRIRCPNPASLGPFR
jgi:hypothetical protein